MSELRTHFAWFNVGVLCGDCGWEMDIDTDKSFSVGYKWLRRVVFCYNPECSQNQIRYEVQKSSAVNLVEVKDDK